MIRGFIPRGRHLLLYDILATGFAVVLSFVIRFDANDIAATMAPYLPAALLPLLVNPVVYVAFRLYRREWQYASVREMFAIAAAVVVATTLTVVIFLVLSLVGVPGTFGFPRSVFAIECLLNIGLVGGGRFLLRANFERRGIVSSDTGRAIVTLVYGAGEAGATVTRLADRDPAAGIVVVGFLDDEQAKRGSRLMGRRVFGGLDQLGRAASETDAGALLVAMPSANGASIRRALQAGRELDLEVRTVPPLRELVSGEFQLSKIRKLSVVDLLRREPIAIDMEAVASYLNGASVLVTGGGGSIGSELARQILALGPRSLTIIDHHEWTLWSIERELAELAGPAGGVQVRSILGDVRSRQATNAIFRQVKPDVVFHAAALKHVSIVEQFPSEGVLTNVIGTRNVLRACEGSAVSRFVLVSTDKAVEPSSVMGATKRLAEHLTVAAASRTGLPYTVVRFGNVLGSSGSVIPIFQHQLEEGKPITITHPDATRYFMTIPEAVSLILEAGSTSQLGEVYVLDMGEPIRILDLARDLIQLGGRNPDAVPFIFTGLRPGERLHETLFYSNETADRTPHQGILRARPGANRTSLDDLEGYVDALETAAHDRDDQAIRETLRERDYLASATLVGNPVEEGA
jgi:FlaA1/EpsC-like NDP-sugar epimerase